MITPIVKLGDKLLRRKSNGGEPDTWVECSVNKTYLELVKEFPGDYRKLDGSDLEMAVCDPNSTDDIAEKVVEYLGRYVNGLGRRDLGMQMMDEVAVMQMKHIVEQILDNPSGEVEIPEYD